MAKRITILAVTGRRVKTDVDGNHYIEHDTEVVARVNPSMSIGDALHYARIRFPAALSLEIYEPRTDSSEVERL